MLSFFKAQPKNDNSSPQTEKNTHFSQQGNEHLNHLVHTIEEFESCLEREEYYFENRPGFIARGLIAMKKRLSLEYQGALETLAQHMEHERPPRDIVLFLKDRLKRFEARLSENYTHVHAAHDVLKIYDESVRRATLKQQPKVMYSARGSSIAISATRCVAQV